MKNWDHLVETVKKLRHPEKGCPWDLKQTHQSLKKYLIEETYEVLDAIDGISEPGPEMQLRMNSFKDELGDILLQVLLHAEIASETGYFKLGDVIENLNEKLIRRHPHVFHTENNQQPKLSIQEIEQSWEKIKKSENPTSQNINYVYSKKDLLNPALVAAQHIGEKSQKIQFDYPDATSWWEKVQEEVTELASAKDRTSQEDELGDVLFSLAQWARHLGINAEAALKKASQKFIDRTNRMQEIAISDKLDFEKLSFAEKDQLWSRVKK